MVSEVVVETFIGVYAEEPSILRVGGGYAVSSVSGRVGKSKAVSVGPRQFGPLLKGKLEGIGEGLYKRVLGQELPVQVFGYRLPAHLITGDVREIVSDVVRAPNVPVARQSIEQLP
jgi:hypothetical protein